SWKDDTFGVTFIDGGHKVIVTKVKPNGEGTVNAASGAVEGQLLEEVALTGKFTNPHTGNQVEGVLAWDAPETLLTISEEGTEHSWTFTPSDQTNYETVTGTATVIVSARTPTTIILDGTDTFDYNGRPQGLKFKTDRQNDNTPIVVEYEVDGQWTTDAPKNVGTYPVKATIAATKEYEMAEHTEALTIKAVAVTPNVNVTMAKPYDGTTKATVTLVNLLGRCGSDDVSVTFTAAYETKDAGHTIITIRYGALTGKDAGNYYLSSTTKRESGTILTKAITITAKDIKKEYGDELTLTGDMFTAKGLVDGESLASQHVDYASEGTASEAKVGTYPVTARAHGGNYTTGAYNNAAPVEAPAGNMEVVPAVPVVSDSGVKAGEGKQGGKLKDVALNGSFVNPHNSSMSVEGELAWTAPETDLPLTGSTFKAQWKFTPSDTANYTGTVTGEAEITLLSLPTVKVTANNKTVEYNGQPQGIDEPVVEAGNADKVALEIEYRLHKDVISTFALEKAGGHDDFTTEKPVDAGTYDVHVHVNVLPAFVTEFANELLQPTLIITQAKPDVSGVTVEGGSAVPEGTVLTDVTLTGAKGLDGKALGGAFAWEHPYTVMTEEGDYSWTFTPDDPNYAAVTGSSHLTLAEDTRTIQATVYNLPNSLGHGDYAVVDVEKSGLKAGDVIVFYKDASDPVCEPVTVTAADVTAKTLTVQLDEDALSAGGGSLTSSISSSSQHTADPVPYPAEMGFTVPETLVTYVGKSEVLDIVEAEGYEVKSVSITANTGDFITVEKSDAIDAVITALSVGSTTLEVSLTFVHPDPAKAGETITISKTVYVAVMVDPGKVEVEVKPEEGAPEVSIQGADQA
ncbi:YDG domain-containing protein, partial [uncultured Dysosmobacter sp.]|uniref:YDG domain-containing protein n=1 Tax=uncultured Dysosmobacter sp. TaxID=2591384 RepID=UPI002611763B